MVSMVLPHRVSHETLHIGMRMYLDFEGSIAKY
jgi:hypothetical protein